SARSLGSDDDLHGVVCSPHCLIVSARSLDRAFHPTEEIDLVPDAKNALVKLDVLGILSVDLQDFVRLSITSVKCARFRLGLWPALGFYCRQDGTRGHQVGSRDAQGRVRIEGFPQQSIQRLRPI